jgi:hypothetical protein
MRGHYEHSDTSSKDIEDATFNLQAICKSMHAYTYVYIICSTFI